MVGAELVPLAAERKDIGEEDEWNEGPCGVGVGDE